jgi:[ribosomal protein S5]-alanine N-acetyltransferase
MLEVSFTPFPNLTTERLFLRQITPDDVEEVYAIRSDPETMRYIPRPLAKTREDAMAHIDMVSKALLDNESIVWAITCKEDNKLIGMICLLRFQLEHFRTELGYILHPAYHRQGIMNEAIQPVVDYAFNALKFHSIEAVIDPDNAASQNLLIKNHFVKEAHLKENEYYDGRFLDTVIYSLLNKVS